MIERAARLQLLAMSAGTVKPIAPELGREAHDWIDRPKRHSAAFNYFARQALRAHGDCLN
ncbi:class II aldolase/adducin domain protein [compost metagenome]